MVSESEEEIGGKGKETVKDVVKDGEILTRDNT